MKSLYQSNVSSNKQAGIPASMSLVQGPLSSVSLGWDSTPSSVFSPQSTSEAKDSGPLSSHAPHTPPLVEDKADVRRRAKGLQPRPHPRALPALPVWEHLVVTPLRTQGFRDVTGYKPSFLHGINIVSRGLKYGVVGHEVSGPNVSVISLNVNS